MSRYPIRTLAAYPLFGLLGALMVHSTWESKPTTALAWTAAAAAVCLGLWLGLCGARYDYASTTKSRAGFGAGVGILVLPAWVAIRDDINADLVLWCVGAFFAAASVGFAFGAVAVYARKN